MARITVNGQTIALSEPIISESSKGMLLGQGQCSIPAEVLRGSDTITFYPVIYARPLARLRLILEALKLPPAIKIEQLELHLSALLGSFTWTPDYRPVEGLLKCYHYRYVGYPVYVSCRAQVLHPFAGAVDFILDFPVGFHRRVTALPVCCPDEAPVDLFLPPKHALPVVPTGDGTARELYRKAARREADALGTPGPSPEAIKPRLGLKKSWRAEPGLGLDFDYLKHDRPDDEPVFKPKLRKGF